MPSFRDQYSFAFCDNPKCDLHVYNVEVSTTELRLTNLDPGSLGDPNAPAYTIERRHTHVHYGKVVHLCDRCEAVLALFPRRP